MDNNAYKLISLMMRLGCNNDYFMFGDEKLLNLSVSLVIEIDNLLDDGYTKEEVTELIDKSNFYQKDIGLTMEEANTLKEYAYHLLDIRYDIFMDNKKEEKVKKYLFNK